MPEAFLSLDAKDQREILNTCAEQTRRPAAILEKDIWICWVLQTLFSMPSRLPMVFKGGTSLSKVYGIINRFSEDVDITLDYRAFGEDHDPFAEGMSNTANKKFSKRLKSHVSDYIHGTVAPLLARACKELATADQHDIHIDEDGEKVWFSYPSAVENPMDYLRTDVLLEFGGRNAIEPNELHEITSDIAELTPRLAYPKAIVTVLSPVRTFWEKATLIHVECHRRRLAGSPHRLSRHWFDLASLASHETGRAALNDRDVLEDVVRYKKIFFNAGNAHYDHCLDGRLRLVPDKDQLAPLKSDYETMRLSGMLLFEVPKFDGLIDDIQNLETKANRLNADLGHA